MARRTEGWTVALATWAELPRLSPDDQLLVGALGAEGIAGVPAVWTDGAVPWERFDLVIVRSTWDYHRRLEEFLAWVDRVEARTRLLNVGPTVRWNARKTYLRDLERAGVPTVPTAWGSDLAAVVPELRRRGWERAVLKPAVSANADRTHRVDLTDGTRTESLFRSLREAGEVLVQPYMTAVDGPGEHSLVFLDGAFSHAVVRAPRLSSGSSLVEGAPTPATPEEEAVAVAAMATVRPRPLYARVDLVADPAGHARVMELELIEPYLYLGSTPGSAARLALAIRRRLEAPVGDDVPRGGSPITFPPAKAGRPSPPEALEGTHV